MDTVESEVRRQIAAEIEDRLRPLIEVEKYQGGFDCCGCSTYDFIVDDAIAIALGRYEPKTWDERKLGA